MPRRRSRDDYDDDRNYRHEHRTRGSLGAGFGLSLGCLLGISAFLIGGIILVVAICAGGVQIGNFGREAREKFEAEQRQKEAGQQKDKASPKTPEAEGDRRP